MAHAMDHLDAIVVGLDTLAKMTARNVPDRVRADFIVRALELAGYVIVPEEARNSDLLPVPKGRTG